MAFLDEHTYIGFFNVACGLWDIRTGKILKSIKCEDVDDTFYGSDGKYIHNILVLPDKKRIITCGNCDSCNMFDLETGKCLIKYRNNNDALCDIRQITLCRDGKYLVTCDTYTSKLWDVELGSIIRVFSSNFRQYTILIYNDKYLIVNGFTKSGEEYGLYDIFDIDTGVRVETYKINNEFVVNMYSHDDKILSYDVYGDICVWNFDNGQIISTIQTHIRTVTYGSNIILIHPVDNILIIYDFNSKYHIYSLITYKLLEIRQLDMSFARYGMVCYNGRKLVFSPDKKRFIAGSILEVQLDYTDYINILTTWLIPDIVHIILSYKIYLDDVVKPLEKNIKGST